MSDLVDITIADARDLLSSGETSSRELAEAQIGAMDRHRDLNAFITETPETALAMADASDKRRAAGEVGALEGIPVAIKDLFCTKGLLTTAGSHVLDGFEPAL